MKESAAEITSLPGDNGSSGQAGACIVERAAELLGENETACEWDERLFLPVLLPLHTPAARIFEVVTPEMGYSSMAGVSESMQDIRELVEPMFLHPELFQHLGITPPRGILLHGPPGKCFRLRL